jgi:hypothetical protein
MCQPASQPFVLSRDLQRRQEKALKILKSVTQTRLHVVEPN